MNMGTTEAYWATTAQVGIVLALTIVIEARFAIRAWTKETDGWVRKLEAIVLAVTVACVVASVNIASGVLAADNYEQWQIYFTSWATGAGIGIAALGPIVRIVTAAYAAEIIRFFRRGEAKTVDAFGEAFERIAAEQIESQLTTLKLIEDIRDNAVDRLTRAKERGDAPDVIAELEGHVRDREKDVKHYRKRLKKWNDKFDEAEEMRVKMKATMDETNKAAADLVVEEQAGYGSAP